MNLPATFQTPNEYVDYFCSRLTGAEFKLLMVAVRKICGYPDHRRTMRDRISLSQFMEASGLTDRVTVVKSLRRLETLGILKAVGKANQFGQEWKLVRHRPKIGQQELALELPNGSGNQTRVVGKPDQSGRETRHTKPIIKQTSKTLNVTDETMNQKQLESKEPATNDEIVKHLREMASSGNGVAAGASQTLLVLEQLWVWDSRDEVQKSWKWFFHCAQKWPREFDRAFGMTRERMQRVDRERLRAPGAYLTRLLKTEVGLS